jgi:hypothetical protein
MSWFLLALDTSSALSIARPTEARGYSTVVRWLASVTGVDARVIELRAVAGATYPLIDPSYVVDPVGDADTPAGTVLVSGGEVASYQWP